MLLEEWLPHDGVELILKAVSILPGLEQSLFDVLILTGCRLQGDLLHRQGISLILRLFDLVEELSLVALSLLEDVRLDLEARFYVLEAASVLHKLELSLAPLAVELLHVESATSHALGALDISYERQAAIFGLVERRLQVAKDLGTLQLSLARLLHALVDCRVQRLATR